MFDVSYSRIPPPVSGGVGSYEQRKNELVRPVDYSVSHRSHDGACHATGCQPHPA
jgi:hypothetical protein